MLSTAVTTRFALMIVCDRNNGINRAETRLPTKPKRSSAIPAMKMGASIAVMVDRRVGPFSATSPPAATEFRAALDCRTDAVP